VSFARREFELTPQPLLTVLVVTAVQVTYTLMAVVLHLRVAVDTGHYCQATGRLAGLRRFEQYN